MGTITPVYGWPYQQLPDPPDGAALGQNLALAIEATVQAQAALITSLSAQIAALQPNKPIYRNRITLTSSQPNVTFSNIPTNLRNLRIEYTARADTAAFDTNIDMRINGDSTASAHRYEYMVMVNLANPTGSGATSNLVFLSNIPAASSTAGQFGSGRVNITGWDSAAHLNWLSGEFQAGYYSNNGIYTNGHFAYSGNGPYTSIVLFPNPGNFIAGSDFMLEGVYA